MKTLKIFLIFIFSLISIIGVAQVKAPKGFDVGGTIIDANEVRSLNGINGNIKDTLDSKVRTSAVSSSLDEFYNKTQSNARFINEDGDTITGTILVPTPAAGTNTTQVVNAAFVSQNSPIIQFQDNVQKSNTGNTNENTVGTYTVRGGSMGLNGRLVLEMFVHIATASQGSTFKIYANGNLIGTAALSTNTYSPLRLWFVNTNSLVNQMSGNNASVGGMLWASGTAAFSTYSGVINTANDITITITITAGNSAYTGYLDNIIATTYYTN